MTITVTALLILVVGLVIYAITAKGTKAYDAGLVLFLVGLLVIVLRFSPGFLSLK